MHAHEDMIRHTATETAPWHVVPADSKWFSRLIIAAAIVERLEVIDPKFPEMDAAANEAMEHAREVLVAEKSSKGGEHATNEFHRTFPARRTFDARASGSNARQEFGDQGSDLERPLSTFGARIAAVCFRPNVHGQHCADCVEKVGVAGGLKS